MARLPVRQVYKLSRVGFRALRRLAQTPETPGPGVPADPWLPARPAPLRRARQWAAVGAVLGLAFFGLALLGPLALLLGVGTAQGSTVAGVLLGLVLLLGLAGSVWAGLRIRALLRPETPGLPAAGVVEGEEAALLDTLHAHRRALPPASRSALQAAVLATRDALRVSAPLTTLDRDTYDARRAAREDLPELLGSYRAAPPHLRDERELTRQLRQIEGRMQQVIQTRQSAQARTLAAQSRYLDETYGAEPDVGTGKKTERGSEP